VSKTGYVENLIKQWLVTNLPTVSVTNPVTIHLDELIGDTIFEKNTLTVSIDVYQTLVEQLVALETPVKPGLVIPLVSSSRKLTMKVPLNLEELIHQRDQNEPPSLYLIDWRPNKTRVVCEEFHTPLSFNLLTIGNQVYSYYREFRYSLGIKNNWEYSRAVYVEFFPDGLLIQ